MPDEDELAELLGLAMALSGRPGAAADLVGTALTSAGPAPEADTESGTGAETETRTALRNRVVRAFVETRGHPDPADDLVADLPGELALVAARLDRLPRPQRACAVLTVRDRRTHREIAGLLDRPLSTVERWVTEASFALGAPPYVVAATLDAIAEQAPDAGAARRAAGRVQRRRGRSRRRGLTVVLALVLAVAVAVPLAVGSRDPYLRPPGAWSSGFTVQPPDGWQVESRTLTATSETVVLRPSQVRGRPCLVRVASWTPEPPPQGREVPVRGRPGLLTTGRTGEPPTLSWSPGPGSTASVQCPTGSQDPVLLDLADRVRFGADPVLVPFDLRPAAPLVAVTSVTTTGDTVTAELMVSGKSEPSVTAVQLSVPGVERRSRASVVLHGPGATTRVYDEDGRVTVCRDLGFSRPCAAATAASPARYDRAARAHELLTLLSSITFAPTTADRNGWFDARQAIPA